MQRKSTSKYVKIRSLHKAQTVHGLQDNCSSFFIPVRNLREVPEWESAPTGTTQNKSLMKAIGIALNKVF